MKKGSLTYKQGFSLLELLIYIAILSILMVVISQVFIALTRGRGQAEARSEVNSAVRFATERIKQDIKRASAISLPALGTPSASLRATTTPNTMVLYDVSGGALRRTEGNGTATTTTNVTGDAILVDAPMFTRLENYNTVLQATTTAVRVEMVFRYNSVSSDWSYQDTLRTTVTLH